MVRTPPLSRPASRSGFLVAATAWWIASSPANAEPTPAPLGDPGWQVTVGGLLGATLPDASLADYQWDVAPRAAWGLCTRIGTDRASGGLRLWNAQTTQDLGAASATSSPQVNLTSWELVGRGRIARFGGIAFQAIGSFGRMRLSYQPQRVTIQPSGPGGPVTVDLKPVTEWIGGGGLALQRPLSRQWEADLEVDHRVFAMDTAHRKGDAIEYRRESFGEWSARLGLAWVYRRS